MNPSIKEIKVDLKKEYKWKNDYHKNKEDKIISDLTFSIDKAEYNALLEFNYNKKLKIDEKYLVAPNPLKILYNNNYITGITNYKIRKGESYKIIVSVSYKESKKVSNLYTHFLPSFSFQFIEVKEMEFGKEISFSRNNNI